MPASTTQTRLVAVVIALALSLVGVWYALVERTPPREGAATIVEVAAPAEPNSGESASLRAPADEGEVQPAPMPLEIAARPESKHATPADEPLVLNGVVGEVRDVLGFPLVGARVSLRAQRGERGAELATTVTDESGRYKIPLVNWRSLDDIQRQLNQRRTRGIERGDELSGVHALALGFDDRPTVFSGGSDRGRHGSFRRSTRGGTGPLSLTVSASFIGYEPRVERREVRGVLPTYLEIDFELEPGRAKRGVVKSDKTSHGGADFGIPGAQVFMLDSNGAVVKRALSLDGGSYTLFFPEVGRYDLFARHTAFGTAFLAGVEVNPEQWSFLPELILRGDGRIRGKVVYPDGNAVEALSVQGRHESIASRETGGVTESERILLEKDRGLVIADGLTDRYGAFVLPGLHPGEFDLRYPEESDPALQPTRRYASNDESVALVFRGYRLRVWVRQDRASPADVPQIECIKLSLDGDGETREQVLGEWNGAGHWLANVRAGDRYLVRAWASNMQSDWTIVDIAPASYETFASLQLFGNFESAEELGAGPSQSAGDSMASKIELDVRDELGAKLSGWSASAVASDGTVPRGWWRAKPDDRGAMPALPPGAYALTVRVDDPTSYLRFGEDALPLVVKPGQTAKAEVRAKIGGRVRLVTKADPAPQGQKTESFARSNLSEVGVRASIQRKDDGDSKSTTLRLRADAKNRKSTDGEWLAIGESAVSEKLFEPGRYAITLEGETQDTRELEITIQRGKTVDAVFDALEP